MVDWKNLFSFRDRKTFPGVVVPLVNNTSAPAPEEKSTPNADDKLGSVADSNDDSLAKASSQEKGTSYNPQSGKVLTLESLRAEVETDVSVSGHDTVYDRMLLLNPATSTKLI